MAFFLEELRKWNNGRIFDFFVEKCEKHHVNWNPQHPYILWIIEVSWDLAENPKFQSFDLFERLQEAPHAELYKNMEALFSPRHTVHQACSHWADNVPWKVRQKLHWRLPNHHLPIQHLLWCQNWGLFLDFWRQVSSINQPYFLVLFLFYDIRIIGETRPR